MLAKLLLLLALQNTTPVTAINSISWDYLDSDITDYKVENFLICLDNQATANCANVPISTGIALNSTSKTYNYKFPPLLAGNHIVTVQACTVNNDNCSPGSTLNFIFQIIIPNPFNLRVVKK